MVESVKVQPRPFRSYFPILDWLPHYQSKWLRLDIIAGLTIMALLVPEGMAYAQLAGTADRLFRALFPNQQANVYTATHAVINSIADMIRAIVPKADIIEVMGKVEDLLDQSVAVESVAELVRLCEKAGIAPSGTPQQKRLHRYLANPSISHVYHEDGIDPCSPLVIISEWPPQNVYL